MIMLDTSVLIACFTADLRRLPELRAHIARGEPLTIASLVLYEWWRGPRRERELTLQEELLPASRAVLFGIEEAQLSAELYHGLRRARGREMDLAIAACAITHEARFWTLNHRDFRDIPGLKLLPHNRAI